MLTIISLGILAIAPWPLYRLLTIPVFRRWHTCFAVRVVGLLFAYASAIAVLAVFAPYLLLPAALLALAILAVERWRARARYGMARGLPPGRLSLVPRGPWVNEAFFTGQADKYGRVFKISQYFRPMVCVFGPGLGVSLIQQHAKKLRAPPVRFNEFIPDGFIRYMTDEAHDKYRRVFQLALNRQVLEGNRAQFATLVRNGLSSMSAASRTSKGVHPSVFHHEALFELVVLLFTGMDRSSGSFAELARLYGQLDINKAGCGNPKKEINVAEEIAEILKHRVDELLECDPLVAGSPPSVLSEIIRRDAGNGCNRTVLLNLVYMIQIGSSDMTGLFTWMIKLLADNAQWVDDRREALCDGDGVLAGNVVKEVLRLEQSEYIYRIALADIEFEGFVIPQGWLVRILIRDGHRDPEVFDRPDRFDASRFEERNYRREEYSPLGIGRHSCLGNQVVDMVGSIFVTELVTAYNIRVIADGPRQYGRAHWEPSSSLRLELKPRAA